MKDRKDVVVFDARPTDIYEQGVYGPSSATSREPSVSPGEA